MALPTEIKRASRIGVRRMTRQSVAFCLIAMAYLATAPARSDTTITQDGAEAECVIVSITTESVSVREGADERTIPRDDSRQDRVVKVNGAEIEGRLQEVSATKVVIHNGIVPLEFDRKEVSSVVVRTMVLAPFERVTERIEAEQWIEALAELSTAYPPVATTPPFSTQGRALFDTAYGAAQRHAQSLREEALKVTALDACRTRYERAIAYYDQLLAVDAALMESMLGSRQKSDQSVLRKEQGSNHYNLASAMWNAQAPNLYLEAEKHVGAAVEHDPYSAPGYLLLSTIQLRLGYQGIANAAEQRRLSQQELKQAAAVEAGGNATRGKQLRESAAKREQRAQKSQQTAKPHLLRAAANVKKISDLTRDFTLLREAETLVRQTRNYLESIGELPQATPTPVVTPAVAPVGATVSPDTASTPGVSYASSPPGQEPGLGEALAMTKRAFMTTYNSSGLVPALKAASSVFLDEIMGWLARGGLVSLLITIAIAGAVFIFNWVLPGRAMRRRVSRGDERAIKWHRSVRWLGALAFLLFLLLGSRWFGGAKERNTCPYCDKGLDNIEDYDDMDFVICPHCRENITPVYSMEDYVRHLLSQIEVKHRLMEQRGEALIERDAMAKLIRSIVTMAVRKRGSDIHIEGHEVEAVIRCRIDGMLHDLVTFPPFLLVSVVSALKVMANLDISERRVPQDGKLTINVDKTNIDIRLNTAPSTLGEKASMRLLDPRSIDLTIEGLGLTGDHLEIYREVIHRPHGLLMVTGPTGSGKTTSLYVAMRRLNDGTKNIVSIEDPVEYNLEGVSQMQVAPAQDFTFATGLRSILRQDPDVILIGEIRDPETAQIAIDASITGHLVLSTLHTIDAVGVFSRLDDLGVKPSRYAQALQLIMAQRLVRSICPECREDYSPELLDLQRLGLDAPGAETVYYHGSGCDYCTDTGFVGRFGLFEMLKMTEHVRAELERGASHAEIAAIARSEGMVTLRQQGVSKVAQGVTTAEEIVRVTT